MKSTNEERQQIRNHRFFRNIQRQCRINHVFDILFCYTRVTTTTTVLCLQLCTSTFDGFGNQLTKNICVCVRPHKQSNSVSRKNNRPYLWDFNNREHRQIFASEWKIIQNTCWRTMKKQLVAFRSCFRDVTLELAIHLFKTLNNKHYFHYSYYHLLNLRSLSIHMLKETKCSRNEITVFFAVIMQ